MNAETLARSVALDAYADYDRGAKRAVKTLLAVLAALLVCIAVWMVLAQLDISVQAKGKVVPSSRTQQIQSLEGGVLRELVVREGQSVRQGDVLATVQNVQFDAELGQNQQTLWAARAALVRLNAEMRGRAPVFPAELEQAAPGLVAEQRALWRSRQDEQNSVIATLRSQQVQRQQELAEARARIDTANAMLGPALETLAMEERLSAQGAGARADLLAVQQRVANLRGELEAARIAVQRIQAANREAQARIDETRARFLAEVSRERSQNELEAAERGEQLRGRSDRVRRQELRAPMHGVVNRVLVNTLSGVVKPGETIMELVPVADTLQIAVRVQPADIAFIQPGQSAKVRISAYDSSIFGTLDAKVLRVGADSILDEQRQNTFFEVFLETQRNYLGKPEEKLSISTGMAADASILTGKRTMMEYLLKPIVKTFDKALRER